MNRHRALHLLCLIPCLGGWGTLAAQGPEKDSGKRPEASPGKSSPPKGPGVIIEGPAVIDEALAPVARAVAGWIAVVEAVERTADGQERLIHSSPAVILGPKHAMTVAPRLEGRLAEAGVSLWITLGERERAGEAGKGRRRVPAKLLKSDAQTGLAVLGGSGLCSKPLSFNPSPSLPKEDPVVLVEPGRDGVPVLRRGRLVQTRAHVDQGRGKNHLLLFRLDSGQARTGLSYSRWDDDLAAGAGAFLADLQGGFLGIVTPPDLAAGKPGPDGQRVKVWKEGTRGGDAAKSGKPSLKEREILALPADIARLVSESLARGKVPVRGYFGASFQKVSNPPEEVRRAAGLPAHSAVRVEHVFPGGPADRAGIKSGDWLVAIAEKKGISHAEVVRFSELVEYTGAGKAIQLLVAREGDGGLQLLKLRITIGTR